MNGAVDFDRTDYGSSNVQDNCVPSHRVDAAYFFTVRKNERAIAAAMINHILSGLIQ